MTRDQNLLFGVFAVQLNKVSAKQLMDVAAAWATDASRDIPSRLVELKILSEADRILLQRIVDEAVAAHGGDGQKTLASFGGEEQIHQVYRGSIVLTADGQVSIPPTARSIETASFAPRSDDVTTVKGVFETPGRYTNSIEHARGGMGRVLLVHDDFLGREIALKELLPHLGTTEATTRDAGEATSLSPEHPSPVRFSAHILARFLQEARITGQLEHPSIVPVYELGHRKDGSLYYTMKLVRGRSLSKAIKDCPGLGERLRLLPHFIDICQAIAYAHSRQILHRDIKPANVMVGEFGETVVLDWGLAKKCDREDVHAEEIEKTLHAMNLGEDIAAAQTAYGQILGTPAYMAPEQARGELDQVDERSDVYGLGVVLYEILTGTIPFHSKSTRELLGKVIAGEKISAVVAAKDAPPELIAIAEKAMAKEKERRYSTVRALAAEVERFQSGALVQAHRYSLLGYTRFVWKRFKPLIATGVAAFIVLVALAAAFTIRLASERDRAELARTEAVAAKESEATERIRAEAAKEQESEALRKAQETIDKLEWATYLEKVRLAQGHVERGETAQARMRLLEAPEVYRNWEWGYLYAKMDTSLITIHNPVGSYGRTFWSPDEKCIVIRTLDEGKGDGGPVLTIDRVWNVNSGQELFVSRPSFGVDNIVKFSSDGIRAITITHDKKAAIWDTHSNVVLYKLGKQSTHVTKASFVADGKSIVTLSDEDAEDTWGVVRVWDAASGNELFALGHHFKVAVASPDGSRIVALSWDASSGTWNGGKVWDATSGMELFALIGHPFNVLFSPDNTRILTFSFNERDNGFLGVKAWDATSGAELFTLGDDVDRIPEIQFSSDGTRIIALSYDSEQREYGEAKVWDASSGKELFTLGGHSCGVYTAQFSPDGTRIATLSWALESGTPCGAPIVWDTASGSEVFTLNGHVDDVSSVTFSPDSTRIVSECWVDEMARIWDAKSGALLFTLTDCLPRPGMNFNATGTRLVGTSTDGSVKVWDAETGEELLSLNGHSSAVSGAILNRDGTLVVTDSVDNTVKVWDANSNTYASTLRSHSGGVSSALYSPNGARIVTVSDDSTARVWIAESGANLSTLRGHSDSLLDAEFSPDGSCIVTASADNTAKVWDTESGAELLTLHSHSDHVVGSSFSPDGTRILTASEDNTSKVWDAASGAQLFTLSGHSDRVLKAVYSPDGKRIVTVSGDRSVKMWDASTGAELSTLGLHYRSVLGAAYSTDGTRIVTWSEDNTAMVWDPERRKKVCNLYGHADTVTHAAFNPDSTRIVTVSLDNSVKIWDTESGIELFSPSGHSDRVVDATFSPDGTRILTSSLDDTARIWNANSGAELLALRGHSGDVVGASFSPNGTRILTASGDGTAKVWEAAPWSDANWYDELQRKRFIHFALRTAPEISMVSFAPSSDAYIDGVKMLEATALSWRAAISSEKSDRVLGTAGQGLFLKRHEGLVDLGVEASESGDLVRSINRVPVDSLAEGATLLENFVNLVKHSPDGFHELRLDVVNRYRHKNYVLTFGTPL